MIKHEKFSHRMHAYVNLVQHQIQQEYFNEVSRIWSCHAVSICVNIMYWITQPYNQLQSHVVPQLVIPFYGLPTHHFIMDRPLDFMSWTS
jgi:hypothetical protein